MFIFKKKPNSDQTSRQPHPSSSMISYLRAWPIILMAPYPYWVFWKESSFLSYSPGWHAGEHCTCVIFFFSCPPVSFTSPWVAEPYNLTLGFSFYFFSFSWYGENKEMLESIFCWGISPSTHTTAFHQLGFAKYQTDSVELENMFQAVFCIDALRCEVSPPGCYMCFSCHGAVCLWIVLLGAPGRANAGAGGTEACLQPCFINPSYSPPSFVPCLV